MPKNTKTIWYDSTIHQLLFQEEFFFFVPLVNHSKDLPFFFSQIFLFYDQPFFFFKTVTLLFFQTAFIKCHSTKKTTHNLILKNIFNTFTATATRNFIVSQTNRYFSYGWLFLPLGQRKKQHGPSQLANFAWTNNTVLALSNNKYKHAASGNDGIQMQH